MVTNYKCNVHDARRKNERAVLKLGISGISGIHSAYSDDRPDLVGVVVSALPHLSGGAWVATTVGEVKALALVSPGDALVTSDGESLVGVSGGAGKDLHLDAVGGGTPGNIEALVPEDLDVTARDRPSLGSIVGTGSDSNKCVIAVAGGSQA